MSTEIKADEAEGVETPAEPAQGEEAQTAHVEHEEEEIHHVSLAARSLQILALLAVGAAFGLWAGPRLAPHLPQGLAPLAAWLSPQTNASTEALESLRAQTAARLEVLESGIKREEIETRLANFQTDIVNPLRDQMKALSDQVAAADGTAIEARLWAAEGRIEGLVAELDSLREMLGNVAEEGGAISADTVASIAAYRTRIDALQAQVDEITARQGEIMRNVAEAQSTASAQVEEAQALVEEASETAVSSQNRVALTTSLTEIETALQSGADFTSQLAKIAEITTIPVPEALSAAATGVQTLEALEQAFPVAAHAAIREDIAAGGEGGGLSGIGSFLRAQVATRSLSPQSGDSADAVLSRMEAALKHGDLALVLEEAAALSAPAAAEMQAWLADVAMRSAALQEFDKWRNALEAGGE